MGVEGYQVVLAHCLQNANYFRSRLHELGYVKILVPENQGPSVGFRLYNPEWVSSPQSEFEYEYAFEDSPVYRERVERNSSWHRSVFLARGKVGLFTNWVFHIAHTDYGSNGRFLFLPGEKAVFMNPATTRAQIDLFIENIGM